MERIALWIGTGAISHRAAQERDEVFAFGAAHGHDGARRDAVHRQCPRHVDPLAARIDPDPECPHDLAAGERLDLDRPVDARVEGHGDDHARRTLGPCPRRSSASRASSPESVISVSISSRVISATGGLADLRVVGEDALRRAARIMARFTAVGRVGCREASLDGDPVGADEGDVDIAVGERLERPGIHRGLRPTADLAADRGDGDWAGPTATSQSATAFVRTTSSRSFGRMSARRAVVVPASGGSFLIG
jgi:hypothetical protein